MEAGTGWLDELGTGRYTWTRPAPALLEAELRPGLRCRIRLGGAGDHPVLYVSIGANGTVHYWQWATLDHRTSEPLPREEALGKLRELIDAAMITYKSRVHPELLGA